VSITDRLPVAQTQTPACPGRLTPREWEESDARRRERRDRPDRPYGRDISPTARLITGSMLAVLVVGMIVVTVLGLVEVLDLFPPPSP